MLEEHFETAGEAGRKELRPELEAFVRRYPRDKGSERARLLLARIAVSERRFGAAEEILTRLLALDPGAARDEAIVVRAAVDNRRGEPEMALARLEPLQGKLLAGSARDAYAREKILAALSLRRWRLAVDSMATWLSEDQGGVVENQRWVQEAVSQVPARALVRVLIDWPDESTENARQWLQRTIIERLTDVALSTQDAALARDLLQRSPPWLRASPHGEKLANLASLARKDAQISGRSVGLVLGGQTPLQRQRVVRVAAGLLRGLGLRDDGAQDTSGEESAVRFVAAEDTGSLQAALSTLSGLGASVLVAGVDPAGADLALTYAEAKEVPVVVMSEPRVPNRRLRYGFVAGTSELTQLVALEGMGPRTRSWRFIGPTDASCDPRTPFPLVQWQQEHVDAVGVLGDERCMRRAMKVLARAAWEPLVAVGLEAARGPFPPGSAVSVLSAGTYPQDIRFFSDTISSTERSIQEGKPPPPPDPFDWFFTLGYDVGQLIRQALLRLPETYATEKDAVHALHKQTRKELLEARSDLLSTHERGFSSEQRLERRLVLRPASPTEAEAAP